jgi:hypothetical protein
MAPFLDGGNAVQQPAPTDPRRNRRPPGSVTTLTRHPVNPPTPRSAAPPRRHPPGRHPGRHLGRREARVRIFHDAKIHPSPGQNRRAPWLRPPARPVRHRHYPAVLRDHVESPRPDDTRYHPRPAAHQLGLPLFQRPPLMETPMSNNMPLRPQTRPCPAPAGQSVSWWSLLRY